MRNGYSGAKIEVKSASTTIKSGKSRHRLCDQARKCQLLYPVTPKIIAIFDSESMDEEGYLMETLCEPPMVAGLKDGTHWMASTLTEMRKLLHTHVWNRVAVQTSEWIPLLCEFMAQRHMASDPLIKRLFIDNDILGCYGMIHGDPTVANVMYRGSQIVIIDPLPDSPKVPSHMTVDLGKMLQSAIGWESVTWGWKYKTDPCIDVILPKAMDGLTRARAWFWCAVHLLRTHGYVEEGSVEDMWAQKQAYDILTMLEMKCCTDSISMARS